jgi:hypothetical protein
MFFCPSSRAVWFGSQLGLRVDDLSLDFKMAFMQIINRIPKEMVPYFYGLMWCIWKGRNREVIEGRIIRPWLGKGPIWNKPRR